MNTRQSIKSLNHDELSSALCEMGLPRYRVSQLEQWLWQKGATSFDEMTNLSKQLRASLAERFSLSAPHIHTKQESADGTRKYLIQFDDNVMVETVGIPSHDAKRLTVCFSTQAGCAMGCTFCATGQGGFTRNLSIGEMVDQIRVVADDFGKRVTNVVAMGQGEPFLNYNAVLPALNIMNSKIGFEIGARHITVSTCGILDGIYRFSQEPYQFTLAVSLHSAVQTTRDTIMPGVKNYKLTDLRDSLKVYGDTTKRRPTLEYAPIQDVNDDDEHIDALINFCSGMLSHVNLIPLNPISQEQEKAGMLQPSSRLHYIENALLGASIECSIRSSRGGDIDGACGQLRQRF